MKALLAMLVILLAPCLVPGVLADDEAKMMTRVYEVHHLESHEAALLARQRCLELNGPQCDFKVTGGSFFEFYTDRRTQDEIAKTLQGRDLPPATQVFQVTLLVATDGQPARPTLPESGSRALDDLESFLPYRHYTLLDAGVTRTADRANMSLGGDQGYRAQLRFRGDPRLGMPLKVEFAMDQVFRRWVPGPSQAAGGEDRPQEVTEGLRAEDVHRDIVETSFSMEVGETVVVGTSKLNGGEEALVVLVTAAKD